MKKHPAACEAPDGYSCPVEATIDIIGGKWKSVILYHLIDDKKRFNELRRLIPGVTQRMLTLQLQSLSATASSAVQFTNRFLRMSTV